ALIPDRGDGGLAFFHKGQAQQRTALHGIAEGAAVIAGFGDFLEFADGFFKKAHLAESSSEIVMGLEIFLFRAHFAKFCAKLFEDFHERAGLGSLRRRARHLWLCRRRGRSAGFRIGEGRSERVHAQLIDFPSKLSQELIGFESAAGRGCRRLVLCGRGRLGRLLIVGGNQLFLLEHEFVLLFPFEFGLGRLGRLRRRGRGFRLWRRGRWGLAWLRRLSFFEQRGPLVGQIHFLNFCFLRRGVNIGRLRFWLGSPGGG